MTKPKTKPKAAAHSTARKTAKPASGKRTAPITLRRERRQSELSGTSDGRLEFTERNTEPLCPRTRTSSEEVGTSHLCQEDGASTEGLAR
jgi:hypothetical protein